MTAHVATNGKTSYGVTRFVVLAIAALQLSFMLVSVISFNAAYVSMLNLKSSPLWEAYSNGSIPEPDWSSHSLPIADRRYKWGFTEKSYSFGGVFVGALLGTQPIRSLMRRHGAHKSMVVLGSIAAVSVILSPWALSYSFAAFVAIRLTNGAAYSNLFPAAGMVVTHWAPLKERGIFVAVLTGHVEIAGLYAIPMGGFISTHVGWPHFYWLNGIILAVLTLLWGLFYRDHPHQHPYMSEGEVLKCAEGKSLQATQATKPPVRKIVSTPVILASWLAVVGQFQTSQYAMAWAPVYLCHVLDYSPAASGIITAVPLLLQFVTRASTGILSDRLSMCEVLKLRIFNSVSFYGGALCFAVIAFMGLTHTVIDIVLAMAPIGLLGVQAGGYSKGIVLVSRQHTAFVMSVVGMTSCATMLGGSFIVPALTPNNSFEEWRNLFFVYVVVLVATNTVYVVCARSDAAAWTEESDSPSIDTEKRSHRQTSSIADEDNNNADLKSNSTSK